jgi:hypothetical protein
LPQSGAAGAIFNATYFEPAAVQAVYRGAKVRSQAYRGTRTDGQLYRGAKTLFP